MVDNNFVGDVLLIVDSSPFILERLFNIFEQAYAGALIVTASNFDEAVIALKRQRTDIVLLDIQLPGSKGIALVNLIKVQYPQTQIIVQTNLIGDQYRDESKKAGAGFFVDKSKNFDLIPEIVAKIRNKGRICSI